MYEPVSVSVCPAGSLPIRVELEAIESGDIRGYVPTHGHTKKVLEGVAAAAAGIRRGVFPATPGSSVCGVCHYQRSCAFSAAPLGHGE